MEGLKETGEGEQGRKKKERERERERLQSEFDTNFPLHLNFFLAHTFEGYFREFPKHHLLRVEFVGEFVVKILPCMFSLACMFLIHTSISLIP